MNRSKIYLGLTTALLAAAGIAFTKAAYYGMLSTWFYCTHIPTVWNPARCATKFSICTNTGGVLCIATISGSFYTLYADGIKGLTTMKCVRNPAITDKCQNPVKFLFESE